MYLPPSQYTVKYTNGDEYRSISTRKPYKGYYIETLSGQFYAGSDPQLITDTLEVITDTVPSSITLNTIDSITYNRLTQFKTQQQGKFQPVPSSKPKPTQQDYQNGFFTRYISVRRNDVSIQEISKDTYDIMAKRTQHNPDLYSRFKFNWELGDNAAEANTKILRRLNQQVPGIFDFFINKSEYSTSKQDHHSSNTSPDQGGVSFGGY
jgi:hypothetical protein